LSIKQSLPTTTFIQHKIEATEIEMPTTTFNDNVHVKPPYSYVTLIRQAILSTRMRRMTLNEIYQWIVDDDDVEFSPICMFGSHPIYVKLLSNGATVGAPFVDFFLLCAF
ncbi:unnamed protein product, partial [Rotaria sp. Silwood2]